MRHLTTSAAATTKPAGGLRTSRSGSADTARAKFAGITAILFAYLTIDYVRPHDIWPPLAAAHVGLVLSLILMPFSLTRFGDPVYRDTGIRCLMVFIALGAFSMVYAVNHYWVYQYTRVMVTYLFAVIVPICVLMTTMTRLRKLVALWISLHCFLGVYAMTHGGLGPGSFLEDENDLALALLTALPYAYFLYRSKSIQKKTRLALLIGVAVILGGIIATMSRGGFIGLVMTAGALVIWSRNRVRNVLVICVLGTLFYVFMPDQYKTEIDTITDVTDETRVERIVSWRLGWEMFVDNPVLGVGVGNYNWRVEDYQELGEYGLDRLLGGRVAHSLYFTLLPETGLVGTLLVLIIVVHMMKQQRRSLRIALSSPHGEDTEFIEACARATLVALIAFLSTSAFISVLYYPELWYLLGFSYAVHRNALDLPGAEAAS